MPATTYHVTAGSFESQKNAEILESTLHQKGYSAVTIHQTSGGRDQYIVQVGVFHNQVAADEMVSNLQRDGFPASVNSSSGGG